MEISREQYQKQEDAQNQKELIQAIKNLIPVLSKDDDSKILELIDKHSQSIERIASAIKDLPRPEVNVHTDQGVLIEAISEMQRTMLISLENLKNIIEERSKAEYHVKVTRGKYNDLIEEMVIKQII